MASPARAQANARCFVCGQDNDRGLKLRFETQDGRSAFARWTPAAVCEGFDGIVHGGLVSTVLDEAMSKAVAAAGVEALTAELRVRFRLPVQSGCAYQIRGWIVRRGKRLVETEAALLSLEGVEHAHAWAAFLAPSRHASSSSRLAAESASSTPSADSPSGR